MMVNGEDGIGAVLDRIIREQGGLLSQEERQRLEAERQRRRQPWYAKAPVIGPALRAMAWLDDEIIQKRLGPLITAPFSPSLPRREGESWWQHQAREYAQWKSPKFIKGLIEFANPIYFVPIGGTLAKVGGVLGKTGKPLTIAGKAISTAEQAPMKALGNAFKYNPVESLINVPSNATILSVMNKPDAFRRLSQRLSRVPGGEAVVKAVGGEAAFLGRPVRGTAEAMQQFVREAILIRANVHESWGNSAKELILAGPRSVSNGDAVHLFGTKTTREALNSGEGMVARKVGLKPGRENESLLIGDILERIPGHPDNPYILTKAQAEYIEFVQKIGEWGEAILRKEGILELGEKFLYQEGFKYVHRPRPKMMGEMGENILTRVGASARIGGKAPFEKSRWYESMLEGAQAGKRYGADPDLYVSEYIDWVMRRVADKRAAEYLKPLMRTAAIPEEVIGKQATATATRDSWKRISESLKYAATGSPLRGATIRAISRRNPELAVRVQEALAIRVPDVPRVIQSLSKDVWQAAKIEPATFRETLGALRREELRRLPQNITPSDVRDVLKLLNVDARNSIKIIKDMYSANYKLMDATRKVELTSLRDEARKLLRGAQGELNASRELVSEAQEAAKAHLGETTLAHPAFGGSIAPVEVANELNRLMGDVGNQFFAQAEKLSAAARMLKATADFSAPFIQGLPLLALRPEKWGMATLKHYRAFLSPNVARKFYLDNWDEMVEMINHGVFVGGAEFFEAMGPLSRIAGNLPSVIGEMSEGALKQTFGRFGASFGHFGDIARLELWRGLRSRAGGDLDELGRMVNRMTGVSSTKGIGIGVSQRQFEGAFVFFAPRYRRAILSNMADVFKGGMTGTETRRMFSHLLAGGAAMYIGTAFALGQTPNFDPRSGRFMTIKIGDRHYGVGSAVTGTIRLVASAAVSADDPAELIKVWEKDNLFNQYFRGVSAPFTGYGLQAIEKRDFIGNPIETPEEYLRFAVGMVTPIGLTGTFLEGEPFTPLGLLGEEMGLRTFPKSPATLRNERREELIAQIPEAEIESQQQEKWRAGELQWGDLTTLQKGRLEQDETLARFTKEAQEVRVTRGGVEEKVWGEYFGQLDKFSNTLTDDLDELQDGVLNREITLSEFRKFSGEAFNKYGVSIEGLKDNERFTLLLEELAKPKDPHLVDNETALWDYRRMMYEIEGLEDRFGRYDYKEKERREQEFIQKWGMDAWRYVQAVEAQTQADQPFLMGELRQVREFLKPYWALEETILRKYPRAAQIQQMIPFAHPMQRKVLEGDLEYQALQRDLERARQGMRLAIPAVDALLYLWHNESFNRTWLTPRALSLIQNLSAEYSRELSR